MKALILLIAGMFMTGTVYASDAEESHSATVDHSKNPLTETKTENFKKDVA